MAGDLLLAAGVGLLASALLAWRFASRRSAEIEQLLESAPDAMVLVDLQGRIVGANQPTAAMFGFERSELIGQAVELLVPDEHRAAHVAQREAFAQQGVRRPMAPGKELRGKRKDGRAFPVEISLVPVTLGGRRLVASAIRDVTDRRAAERRFRELLESAPDAMVIVNGKGEIELVNSRTEALFGYARSELIGQRIELLVPVRVRKRHVEYVERYLGAPDGYAIGEDRIFFGRRRDGSEFPASLSLSPIRTEAGLCVSAVVRDATLRKEALDSMRLQADELERAVAARTAQLAERAEQLARSNAELEEFAYVVSHDLKSPLRGISSLAQWIETDCGDQLGESGRESLALLKRRADRMHHLIEGVLAFARATGAHQEKWIDAAHAARNAIEQGGAEAGRDVAIEGELPSVWYDELQLTRVFENLIANALKHAQRDGVRVRVSAERVRSGVELRVRDDGAGVPAAHRERIFRMFQTLRPSDSSSGMGLAIVKKIVESNQGSVGVRDAPGGGAEFYFTIPEQRLQRR